MSKRSVAGLFRIVTHIDAENLRKYLNTLSTALEQEYKRFETRVEEEVRQLDSCARDEYYDLSGEHWQLSEVIPNLLYNSILTATYSFLEHLLVKLAKRIGSNRGISLQPNELKYKGIKQARCYLGKILGIPFSTNKDWDEIQHLKKIRDSITHANGIIPKDKKYDAIRGYIQKINGLSIDQFGRIKVEEPYCQYAINLVERFIIKIIENCERSENKIH